MTGKGWKLFRLVSMLLVATSFYCVYGLYGISEFKFWIMLGVVSLIGIAYLMLFMNFERNIHSFVSEMESQLNLTERDSLYKFPAPALITDENGKIIWFNKAFTEQVYPGEAYGLPLGKVIDIDMNALNQKLDTVAVINSGHYRIKALTTEKKDEGNEVVSRLTLLYFQDISEFISVKNEYEISRNYVMIIMVDSFDELFSKAKDSDKTHNIMQIDKLTETFIEERKGLIKKLSDDRYFAMISEEELRKLIDAQFKPIIEKAHQILVSEHNPVTLSIGIGRCGRSLRESEEMARQALDMAQGRGGDQVIIRDENGNFTPFGGNSAGTEKSTKVKTRVFAVSLINLIKASDGVIIMGHAGGDLDALGSAAGLCGAIRAMGCAASIYSNMETTLAMPIIKRLKENLDDGESLFISESEALEAMTDNTLLVIVDVSSKKILDSRTIYEKAKNVVFIDHHRMVTEDFIDNAVLSLHEPYASSASEMVTEVIQYFTLEEELSGYYADAMLAGIMLDTKDFVVKTGVRTFEAAAYLKKMGADTVAVKLMFSDTQETGIIRSHIIEKAEIYKDKYALSVWEEDSPSVKVASAQAADQLLNITGVEASFVIFPEGKLTSVSARSYGKANVEIIMKKLGGGGHQTMAAAKFADTDVKAAREKLLNAIDEFIITIS